MSPRADIPATADRWRIGAYPVAALFTVLVVIVALSVVLSALTKRHVYQLLSEEGAHLASSIRASTLHGLQRMRSSQEELVRKLQVQAARLDTMLTGDPWHDGPMIAEIGEREDLDIIAVYDRALQPLVWTGPRSPHHPRGPRWDAGPPRGRSQPPSPEVCGPLVSLMSGFLLSGQDEQTFDLWGWHHGWHGSGPRPIGYAARRGEGGALFLRTTPDLVRRTLDVASFQGLLDNLALTQKVSSIAVTDPDGMVVFSTHRELIGKEWVEPPPDARLLVVDDPFPLGSDTVGRLHIAMTTDDARQVLAGARRNLVILSTAASLVGIMGLLSVFAVERRHRTRVEAMREALHQQEARLKDMMETQMLAVATRIGEAAAHGDVSDNSEFQSAIEEKRRLEARIAEFQDQLARARAIDPHDVPTDAVGVGSRVTLTRPADGHQLQMTFLGPWDSAPARNIYNYQTPLAQSLMGKAPGDTVTLTLEAAQGEYRIDAIESAV